jgi:hypothetical protein
MDVDARIAVAKINAEARVAAQEVASDATRDIDDSKERNKLTLEKVKADLSSQQREAEKKHEKEMVRESKSEKSE